MFSVQGVTSYLITFDSRTSLERYYDFLDVYDSTTNALLIPQRLTDACTAPIEIFSSNGIWFRVTSDGSVNYWGVSVTVTATVVSFGKSSLLHLKGFITL